MNKLLAVIVLLLSGIGIAAASKGPSLPIPVRRPPQVTAPEIDPSSAIAAVTLLIGSLLVVGARLPKR